MNELILYSSSDGQVRLHLRVDGETVWLSQLEIAELFQISKQNVSLHAKNIFEDGELHKSSVVKESLTTAMDGKKYRTQLYNLDLILAIGYRVRSKRGVQGAGSISRERMERIAHERYGLFDQQRSKAEREQADANDLQEIEQIESGIMQAKTVNDMNDAPAPRHRRPD
jgi:hypothetical protein